MASAAIDPKLVGLGALGAAAAAYACGLGPQPAAERDALPTESGALVIYVNGVQSTRARPRCRLARCGADGRLRCGAS